MEELSVMEITLMAGTVKKRIYIFCIQTLKKIMLISCNLKPLCLERLYEETDNINRCKYKR
jgi:hypothetical protein